MVQKCLEKQDPTAGQQPSSYYSLLLPLLSDTQKSEKVPAVLPATYTNHGTEYDLDIEPAEGQAYTETEAYEAMEFIGQGSFGVVQTVRRLVDAKVILIP